MVVMSLKCRNPHDGRNNTWCFALTNVRDEHGEFKLIEYDWTYVIMGIEFGDEGKWHVQGFAQCSTRRRVSELFWIDSRIHWEGRLPQSTDEQARDYCRKDDKLAIEWGEFHESTPSIREKTDWDSALQLAIEDRVTECPARMQITALRNLQRLRYVHKRPKERDLRDLPDLDNRFFWYYGGTGAGKSITAKKNLSDGHIIELPGGRKSLVEGPTPYYIKDRDSKWWDHYAGEDNVLIDEVGFGQAHWLDDVKKWCDHGRFKQEEKGDSLMLRPKKIIFTSNHHWWQIFQTQPLCTVADLLALKRRLVTVYVGPGEDPNYHPFVIPAPGTVAGFVPPPPTRVGLYHPPPPVGAAEEKELLSCLASLRNTAVKRVHVDLTQEEDENSSTDDEVELLPVSPEN